MLFFKKYEYDNSVFLSDRLENTLREGYKTMIFRIHEYF